MPYLAPHEETRRAVRNLGNGLYLLRWRQKARWSGQILWPSRSVREGGRRDAPDRTLGNIALDRREPEHSLIAEPHAQRIDKLTDVDLGPRLRHMRSDRLPFGKRLDPRGGQRGLLDSETGLDQNEALREKLGQMPRVPVRFRCA